MADNVEITEGTGTNIAADEIGGVQYQRVKIAAGADGSATDVSDAAPLPVDDAGGSLTVDNGGTFATQVDAITADLPDTAAGDLAAINAAAAAIQTAVEILDNIVSGSEAQVDIVGALPAGTNAIGKLAANSGVDIGDVDVTSSALPTGAATSALQTSSEALLTTIDADTSTLAGAVSGSEMQADIVSSALPTGAATAALQTSSEALLTTIDADTSTLAGAVSGSEIQADIVAALPAGTNAIGKLAANSGVDIGDVDVTSIAAGENVIGKIGASDAVVTVTCSLPTGALTANDVMFDTQEIAGAARTSGGQVILESVTVLDKDDQGAEFDLLFLDANTSIGTEDSAVSISDSDAEDIVGIVNVAEADYADLINSQVATVKGIGLEMQASGSTSLYVAGVTRGTPTYTASGVIIKFAFLRS